MNSRQSAGLGAILLLLAAALVMLRPGDPVPAQAPEDTTAATKFRSRGAASGTITERTERIRSIWWSVAGGSAAPDDIELARELIQSLPAGVLKELIGEFIHGLPDQGDPALLHLMARRIGDLEAERGLRWLVAEADMEDAESPYEALFRPAIAGWSESDPVGLLGAYFDDEKSLLFRIRGPRETWGEDGIGSEIVRKAAGDDPDEVWRLLGTWQRQTLADDFFDGLDPTLAEHFGKRIKEVFKDRERPGFEHLGGDEESWVAEQRVRKSAATAWFIAQPDHAIAWIADYAPPMDRDRETGKIAGQLSSRLFLKQPDRAMAWIAGKSPEYRAAAAAELGYEIAAISGLPEEHIADFNTLLEWIGPGRDQWLNGLTAALAERQSDLPTDEILRHLLDRADLSAAERSVIEARLR